MSLSLRELAEQVDLTASFLSQIERGQTSPSIDSLRKISKGLDVPIFYFLLEEEQTSPVVRRDQRRRLTRPSGNADGAGEITFELLTPDTNRQMEAVLTEMEPGSGPVPLTFQQETEEFIHVLEGELEVALATEVYVLAAGDSIYFQGALLRSISVVGEGKVRFMSVITPPIV